MPLARPDIGWVVRPIRNIHIGLFGSSTLIRLDRHGRVDHVIICDWGIPIFNRARYEHISETVAGDGYVSTKSVDECCERSGSNERIAHVALVVWRKSDRANSLLTFSSEPSHSIEFRPRTRPIHALKNLGIPSPCLLRIYIVSMDKHKIL